MVLRSRSGRASDEVQRVLNKQDEGLFRKSRRLNLPSLTDLNDCLLGPIFFVKISMCSYEKAGRTGMKIFPYEHLSPSNRDETF